MITGKDILFRSHNFHALCQGTRTNKDALGDTGKAVVLDIFREVIRGTYKRNIETPAMYKGNEREMFALKRAARVNGWPLPIKYNGRPLQDNIGTGMPDHYVPGKLGNDAKCSKSDEQFMKVFFDDDLKNKTYEVQAKRYAIMANLPEWHISYCLENSPEETIISHAWELWKKGEGEGYITESFIDDVRELHNFDHLPDWARVKTFVVKPTNEDALYFEGRAKLAREYFDSLLDKYHSNVKK